MSGTVDRKALQAVLERLGKRVTGTGRLYLIGETSQLAEGWRSWTERIEVATEVDGGARERMADEVSTLSAETGIEILDESPGEVVPLPDGHEERARPVSLFPDDSRFLHFDPYSVSCRFIARGDEPDYHLVLAYLSHGWITVEEMERLLEGLLPRFTEQTIRQDAAEFRRKYHGLLQMWRAIRPGTVHRPTPA